MIIRPERSGDYDSIRQVNLEAFANHPFSHQTEHLIVEALRADGALTLSLVAEVGGQVVGHIAFSTIAIGGRFQHWYTMGPLAVLPARQRQSIGTELVKEGLRSLRALGAQGCVLVGEPGYYCRFGFKHHPELTMEGVPSQYLLSLPMSDSMPRGCVELHSAFFVSAGRA